MSVLEAVSMGKPVICTPVGVLGEIIKNNENGLIVLPGDVETLQTSIVKLLEDKALREKIAKTNQEYARKFFDIATIAGQLADLFDRVMDGSFSLENKSGLRE